MSSCLIFSKVALVNFTYDVIEDWSTGECVDTHHGIFDCTADLYIACSNQLYGHRSWDWTYCSFQNMPNHTVQPGKTPWTNETFRVQLEACAVQANMSLTDLDRCALSETGAGQWHTWRACGTESTPLQPTQPNQPGLLQQRSRVHPAHVQLRQATTSLSGATSTACPPRTARRASTPPVRTPSLLARKAPASGR